MSQSLKGAGSFFHGCVPLTDTTICPNLGVGVGWGVNPLKPQKQSKHPGVSCTVCYIY